MVVIAVFVLVAAIAVFAKTFMDIIRAAMFIKSTPLRMFVIVATIAIGSLVLYFMLRGLF